MDNYLPSGPSTSSRVREDAENKLQSLSLYRNDKSAFILHLQKMTDNYVDTVPQYQKHMSYRDTLNNSMSK